MKNAEIFYFFCFKNKFNFVVLLYVFIQLVGNRKHFFFLLVYACVQVNSSSFLFSSVCSSLEQLTNPSQHPCEVGTYAVLKERTTTAAKKRKLGN